LKSKTYVTFKLALGALVGSAVFMAQPPHRLWAFATLPMVALAVGMLSKRQSQLLLSGAYVAIGLGGFVIGQMFWQADGLNSTGIKLALLLLAIGIITVLRLLVGESAEA
jgi:apolipoprotein N-acyltransferase